MKRSSPPPADPTELPGGVFSDNLRRTILGLLGLALLITAGILALTPGSDESQLWMSSCLRLGSVICLLWLAWPQLSRLHPWLILGGIAGIVAALVLAKQPRVLVMGLIVLIILARLRPRR